MGEHTCEACGDEFDADYDDPTYCSRECMAEGYRKEKVEKECPNCGDTVEFYPSDAERGRKYCSQECANEYKRRHGPRGEEHWLYERDTTECEYCGEEFEHLPSKDRTFCSYECHGQWSSEHRDYPTGADNPLWAGGVSRVTQTQKWRDTRDEILERDGHRCQECGFDKNLHVHHIEPLSEGGRPYDPENLKTLCRTCHRGKHFT